MSERKLIVTADDFGLSTGINNGIRDAYLNGIVTRTSLVSSGEAFDHAVALAKQHEGLKVGVHLTLIEEQPVSRSNIISSLLGPDGKFLIDYKAFFIRYVLRKINLDEVCIELESQIQKVLKAGLNINHLDSHQHLHMLPGIFTITLELAKKYEIRKIRIIKYGISHIKHLKELGMALFETISRKNIMSSGLEFTDSFFGLNESGNLSESYLLHFLDKLQPGTTELMCHPGYMDSDLYSRYHHWAINMHYDSEIAALLSKRVKEKIKILNIQLAY